MCAIFSSSIIGSPKIMPKVDQTKTVATVFRNTKLQEES